MRSPSSPPGIVVLRYARQLVWRAGRPRQRRAMCVGIFKSAEVRAIALTLLVTKICIRHFGTGNESVRQSTSSGIAPFDNCPH
jgi:hypothetical protein